MMATATKATEASYSLREIVGESPPSQIPIFRVAVSKALKWNDHIKYQANQVLFFVAVQCYS